MPATWPRGKSTTLLRLASALALLAGGVSLAGGCVTSSDSGPSSAEGGAPSGSCPNGGGPVPGEPDLHCTDADGQPIVQQTLADACMDSSAGGAAEAGARDAEEEEMLTLFNAEGDDDDCKYHLEFGTSCVEKNQDVTLSLHAKLRTDDAALVDAEPQVEIYLNDTHLAPNTHPKTTMVSDGVYTIGPVRFDRSGRWTVRFHFFEECLDAREESPHGHGAFFVDVP